jgi:hypothetical protein
VTNRLDPGLMAPSSPRSSRISESPLGALLQSLDQVLGRDGETLMVKAETYRSLVGEVERRRDDSWPSSRRGDALRSRS